MRFCQKVVGVKKMLIRWKDFEFEISNRDDIKLVFEFVKEINAEEERNRVEENLLALKHSFESLMQESKQKQPTSETKKRQKSKRNSPEYQGELASKILLEKAIPEMEKGKWYMGKDIIELAGYPRTAGYLYYGLSKLVRDGILEEKRNGRRRLFRLKAKDESEEDDGDEDGHFNLKKMFLEEKKVMDGVIN